MSQDIVHSTCFEYNLALSRKKFSDGLAKGSGQRESHLCLLLTELHSRQMMLELKSLEKQGKMMRTDIPDGASLWQKAVQFISAEKMKFELNTAVD